jgi:hypothetical protein
MSELSLLFQCRCAFRESFGFHEHQLWHGFFLHVKNIINMKKYSIILGMLMIIGASLSSCHAGAHIGTKHHEVGVGASAH